MSHIEPIDGVVLIDPEYVKDRKIFTHVLAAFRYGREDLDVLGLTFRKDLFIAQMQVFPMLATEVNRPLTHLQQRLIKKLGPNAHPFFFQVLKSSLKLSIHCFFLFFKDSTKCTSISYSTTSTW